MVNRAELEERTKGFALRVIRLMSALSKSPVADVLGRQLLRSGTAIGANYREANRAESHNDFIHKLGIVEKEASETQYWLQLLHEAGLGDPSEIEWLLRESGELLAIFAAAGRTAKQRRQEMTNGGLRNAKS